MTDEVVLLTNSTNFAAVHLPSRNFPGVVVQGDTLHALVSSLGNMTRLLAAGDYEELSAEISGMEEQLSEALAQYEEVCHERKIDLPYSDM